MPTTLLTVCSWLTMTTWVLQFCNPLSEFWFSLIDYHNDNAAVKNIIYNLVRSLTKSRLPFQARKRHFPFCLRDSLSLWPWWKRRDHPLLTHVDRSTNQRPAFQCQRLYTLLRKEKTTEAFSKKRIKMELWIKKWPNSHVKKSATMTQLSYVSIFV